VPAQKFVDAVESGRANLVCLSALLTVTMGSMKTTIEALQQAGVREKVKVMVGGAPVTEVFANQIGADACAMDAAVASSRAQELILERRKQ